MTNFLVNLLSPIFTSLGVSVADLTSYIERLSGYIIAILVALVAMIVVMVAAHKAKKGSSPRDPLAGRNRICGYRSSTC